MHTESYIPQVKPPHIFIAPARWEAVFGFAYLILHMFFIGSVIHWLAYTFDVTLRSVTLNLIYLGAATLIPMLAMRRYLLESWKRFCSYGLRNFIPFSLGLAIRYGGSIPFAMIAVLLLPDFSMTPNTEAFSQMTSDHFFLSAFLAVVLAPIAEELMFRGAVYGGLRNKSKVLAYVVSTLLFAFLHVFGFFFVLPTAPLLLMMSLYLPAGFALAWVYEKSGSIWTAIFLHAIMNIIALAAGAALL